MITIDRILEMAVQSQNEALAAFPGSASTQTVEELRADPALMCMIERFARQVEADTIEHVCRVLQHRFNHNKGNRLTLETVEVAGCIRIIRALSPLPASSGPEQPKCKRCDDTKTIAIGVKHERCVCGGDSRCLICWGKIDYSSVVIGDCPACHTPAPAAKEANND